MQSVFLVKIHEVLNSLTSVHFSLYSSVNSPGKYTKNPKQCLCSIRDTDLMVRVALGSESTGEEEKTFFKEKRDWEEVIFLNSIRHRNQGWDWTFLNMFAMQLPL